MGVICLWVEKSVLPSQCLGNMESSLIHLNVQPNPASLSQTVGAVFSFAHVAQGCCDQEFEIWWGKGPGWRESARSEALQEVTPCCDSTDKSSLAEANHFV